MSDADRFNDMTALLGAISKAMYLCYMPDKAMDALVDAHAAVVEELVVRSGNVEAKRYAMSILAGYNGEGNWTADIARIQGSIELDMSVAA